MGKPQTATPATYRSSRTDQWTDPRPYTDASLRLQKYGPVQGMEPASAWALIKFGMPGGIGMAVLFVVSTIAIIAFSGA